MVSLLHQKSQNFAGLVNIGLCGAVPRTPRDALAAIKQRVSNNLDCIDNYDI